MQRYANPAYPSMVDDISALPPMKPALHFVGFRGEEYHSAVRIWGTPDFIHPAWYLWAQQDMDPIDAVISARCAAHSACRW